MLQRRVEDWNYTKEYLFVIDQRDKKHNTILIGKQGAGQLGTMELKPLEGLMSHIT